MCLAKGKPLRTSHPAYQLASGVRAWHCPKQAQCTARGRGWIAHRDIGDGQVSRVASLGDDIIQDIQQRSLKIVQVVESLGAGDVSADDGSGEGAVRHIGGDVRWSQILLGRGDVGCVDIAAGQAGDGNDSRWSCRTGR